MLRVCSLSVVAAVLLACLGACKQGASEAAPPDLSQPPAVKSAMWSLAAHTNTVATLLAQPTRSPDEVARIKQTVDDVAKIAAGLAVDPAAQRHPLVKKGLPTFQTRITTAQAGLAKDPPDLASVDALITSCRECHTRGLPPKPQFSL